MRTTRHWVEELGRSTWLDGVRIKVLDSFLLQDIFIHQKLACVVLRLGQDGVGSVCYDVCSTTLFPNTVSTQHVHCCCLDCYGNRTEEGHKGTAWDKPEKSLTFLSLTGSRPEGIYSDLTSELFSHTQDTHRHAVFCHRVC